MAEETNAQRLTTDVLARLLQTLLRPESEPCPLKSVRSCWPPCHYHLDRVSENSERKYHNDVSCLPRAESPDAFVESSTSFDISSGHATLPLQSDCPFEVDARTEGQSIYDQIITYQLWLHWPWPRALHRSTSRSQTQLVGQVTTFSCLSGHSSHSLRENPAVEPWIFNMIQDNLTEPCIGVLCVSTSLTIYELVFELSKPPFAQSLKSEIGPFPAAEEVDRQRNIAQPPILKKGLY
nr:hypothetical protein CFP56_73892 [Quercus suber]